LYSLAIIGVLTSVLSAFYYLRFIKIIYFDQCLNYPSLVSIDKEKSYLLGSSLIFLIFFFIYPSPFVTFAHKIALWFII
jgi:NADH-quinone oxidoreductase subunit N